MHFENLSSGDIDFEDWLGLAASFLKRAFYF